MLRGTKCYSDSNNWVPRIALINSICVLLLFVLTVLKVYLPVSLKLNDFSQILSLNCFLLFPNELNVREVLSACRADSLIIFTNQMFKSLIVSSN